MVYTGLSLIRKLWLLLSFLACWLGLVATVDSAAILLAFYFLSGPTGLSESVFLQNGPAEQLAQ